jgi:hypothetical protein
VLSRPSKLGLFFWSFAAVVAALLEIAIAATFTNGRVTLLSNLVFGFCVLAEQGPFPFDQLELEEIDLVLDLVDFNPTCPREYLDALRFHRQALVDSSLVVSDNHPVCAA